MSVLLAVYLGVGAQLSPVSSLVATEVIRAGDQITASNTEPAEGGLSEEDEALIGLEVRRTVYAGRPILPGNTREPMLVSRNQMVTVRYLAGGLEIILTGRAMGEAAAGDPVSVMNLTSRKLINGYVTEQGWVLAQ